MSTQKQIQDPTLQQSIYQHPNHHLVPLALYQRQLFQITNIIRTQHLLHPLTFNETLTKAARLQVEYLASPLNKSRRGHHGGPNGERLGERLTAVGYRYRFGAENIGRRQKTPAIVMRKLMQSDGHRNNILSDLPNEIGVYVIRGVNGHLYWAQVFGRQKKSTGCRCSLMSPSG